jgi:AcrR family transcriptional regulator
MDAAVEIFARHGIPASTVEEIARAAEVPASSFFECFKDKDEIVGVVVFAIAAQWPARSTKPCARSRTPPSGRASRRGSSSSR